VTWHLTQTQNPEWKIGDGANNMEWKEHKTVELDPNDKTRVKSIRPIHADERRTQSIITGL
jgi:hypothetical protein